ncbi:MAG: hypothetical protein K6B43_02680 [Treponema sp.]|jgi:hypothetical protein|nr:hypothetical protein [Treponema sp.]
MKNRFLLFFYLLFASNFAFARIITPINKLERIGTQIHLFYEKHDRLPANSGELGLKNEECEFKQIDKNTIKVQLSDSNITYSLNYNVSESHSLVFHKNSAFYGSFKIDKDGNWYDIVAANKDNKKQTEIQQSNQQYVPISNGRLCDNGADFTDLKR